MKKWYKFIFADGCTIMCAGMSADERKVEERKHGKLLEKRPL